MRTKIYSLRSELRTILELDGDLLNCLLTEGSLTVEQFDCVCGKETVYEKNDKFLEYLLDERFSGDYSDVMAALKEFKQEHVMNFISSNGGIQTTVFIVYVFAIIVIGTDAVSKVSCVSSLMSRENFLGCGVNLWLAVDNS